MARQSVNLGYVVFWRANPLIKGVWCQSVLPFCQACFTLTRLHKGTGSWREPRSQKGNGSQLVSQLVSWCFEPSQSQRIISKLKTYLNLSPSQGAHESSNHKFSKIHKISPDTVSHKTKYTHTNIKQKIVEDLVPSVLLLLKKYMRLGHACIMDHSVNLSIPY